MSRTFGYVLLTIVIGIAFGWFGGLSSKPLIQNRNLVDERVEVIADGDPVAEVIEQSLASPGKIEVTSEEVLLALEKLKATMAPLANQVPIYELIARVDTGELINLLDRFLETPNSRFRDEVAGIMLYRVTSELPDELMSRYRNGSASQFERDKLPDIISNMNWRSFDDALSFVEKLPRNLPNLGMLYLVLERASREAGKNDVALQLRAMIRGQYPEAAKQIANVPLMPEEMRGEILARGWETDRSGFSMRFSAFAQSNPGAAMEMALGMDDGLGAKQDSMKAALSAMSVKEPFEALEYSYLMDGYAGRGLERFVGNAFVHAMQKDKGKSLDWLADLSDAAKGKVLKTAVRNRQTSEMLIPTILELEENSERNTLLVTAVSNWSRHDETKAIAWAEANLSDDQLVDFNLGRVGKIVQQDRETAFEFVSSLERFDQRQQAARTMARSWPIDEIPSLIEKLEMTGDRALRDDVLSNVSQKWLQNDLEGVVAFAQTLGEGQLKQRYEQSIGAALVQEGSAREAIDYALGIENANTARSIFHSALSHVARLDPMGAVSLVTQDNRFEEEHRSYLLGNVARDWSRSDPEGAARHFMNLNDPGAQKGMQNIAQSWGQINPSKALNWSMTIPDAKNRDAVIMSLLSQKQVVEAAPYEMENALSAISNPQMKEQALQIMERNLEVQR